MLRNIKSRLYGSALPFIAADRVKVRMQEPVPQKGFRASLVQNFLRARNSTFATAFLFLCSLVSALRERTHNGKHAGACRGKRLAGGASPSADSMRYFRTSVSVPSLSAQMFFCCVSTLFARGVKDAERTTLPTSMPKRTLFSIFSHRTHKGHTVPVRFLFLPQKEVV